MLSPVDCGQHDDLADRQPPTLLCCAASMTFSPQWITSPSSAKLVLPPIWKPFSRWIDCFPLQAETSHNHGNASKQAGRRSASTLTNLARVPGSSNASQVLSSRIYVGIINVTMCSKVFITGCHQALHVALIVSSIKSLWDLPPVYIQIGAHTSTRSAKGWTAALTIQTVAEPFQLLGIANSQISNWQSLVFCNFELLPQSLFLLKHLSLKST